MMDLDTFKAFFAQHDIDVTVESQHGPNHTLSGTVTVLELGGSIELCFAADGRYIGFVEFTDDETAIYRRNEEPEYV